MAAFLVLKAVTLERYEIQVSRWAMIESIISPTQRMDRIRNTLPVCTCRQIYEIQILRQYFNRFGM